MTTKLTQNYNRQNRCRAFYALLFGISVFLFLPFMAGAEEQKLTLTVTPPLFQLNIGPGEFWASSVKVVNTNPYDLILYASVMNFAVRGEGGGGKFIPVIKDDPEIALSSLAQWVEVSGEPIFVPKEQSVDIPFSVRIPEDAPPGGHYAAILVGTRPGVKTEGESVVQVSSFVSSLFFVRVAGDVREEGQIREFLTEKEFYQKPDVMLILRFENTGNVHLQPQGDITIYNMWGKERGKILINQKTNFGNVLPESIRKFVFTWKGENNPFEVGRYKAVATLSFGQEIRQNVFRTTYFWVVPLQPTLGILGGFTIFILFITWAIRAYIRRALTIYQQDPQYHIANNKYRIHPLAGPMREGIIDLRKTFNTERHQRRDKRSSKGISWYLVFMPRVFRVFSRKYAKSLIFMVFFSIMIAGLFAYFGETLIPARSFEIVNHQNI